MTHYRGHAPRLVSDVGSSAIGWLFALIIAATLTIGAWYLLATSGTPSTPNASVQSGLLNATVVQMPLEHMRAA